MTRLASALPLAVLLLAALTTAISLTEAFSGGLPPSDGAQKRGCTCHCATADTDVTTALDGLPAEYEPGKAYDLTVSFSGGDTFDLPTETNEGGFALEVTHGTLATKDDKTKVDTIGGGTKFATHTTAGNSQASWPLKWTAPGAGAGEVTFYLATNNVNGDGQNGNGACTDNWNKIEKKVREKPAPPPPAEEEPENMTEPEEGEVLLNETFEQNTTVNESGEDKGDDDGLIPGFDALVAAAALGVGGMLLRRKK